MRAVFLLSDGTSIERQVPFPPLQRAYLAKQSGYVMQRGVATETSIVNLPFALAGDTFTPTTPTETAVYVQEMTV